MNSRNALGLTPTQNEILGYIAEGQCNKRICRAAGLAEGTVKVHTTAILRAFGAATRTEVVVELAKRAGVDVAAWVRSQP